MTGKHKFEKLSGAMEPLVTQVVDCRVVVRVYFVGVWIFFVEPSSRRPAQYIE